MGPVLGLNQDVSMVFRIHREVSFFSKPAQLRNLPTILATIFEVNCVLTVWRTAADSIGFFLSQTLLHWWPQVVTTYSEYAAALFPPEDLGQALDCNFHRVNRQPLQGDNGGRGKKHSLGNSVWLPEVSYSTVNETSLKVYGCVWEYPQFQWFIIILPMTMAVWGCISPSSETAKQDFHLWYPKNKKTHRDLTKPPKHQ